jgi:hypothetical protein
LIVLQKKNISRLPEPRRGVDDNTHTRERKLPTSGDFEMRALSLIALLASMSWLTAADKESWITLLDSANTNCWKKVDKNWIFAKSVELEKEKGTKLLANDKGEVWVNGTTGRVSDLITKESFGDCEVHVEFLVAKKSNSGIKFHAMYEIQILDSFGKKELSGDDCGGIYPRAEVKGKYQHIDKGIAPKVNAAKPAGEWQTLDVVWRSPRFDDKGEKTENARIVKATLNGQVIHENQELKTHTGANWTKKEVATGPFMLQADHGPVAFRNVKIRPIK